MTVPAASATADPRPDLAVPLLELRGISKSFPGVQALDDVTFAVAAGTVHALVGENGAGKSTLIKILAGALAPDAGTLALEGRPYQPRDPKEAIQQGVSTIYQEFNLLSLRSVVANITLGQEPARGGLHDADYPWGREETPGGRYMANTWQGEFPWQQRGSSPPPSRPRH